MSIGLSVAGRRAFRLLGISKAFESDAKLKSFLIRFFFCCWKISAEGNLEF